MGGKPRAATAGALSIAVRRLVHGMIDGVTERAGADGRIELVRREPFAFVQVMPDHVRVGFVHGAALPDFAGLLDADRVVVVRTIADVEARGLRTLFAAALYDDDTHGFRRR